MLYRIVPERGLCLKAIRTASVNAYDIFHLSFSGPGDEELIPLSGVPQTWSLVRRDDGHTIDYRKDVVGNVWIFVFR
jgi:hypothetical protein